MLNPLGKRSGGKRRRLPAGRLCRLVPLLLLLALAGCASRKQATVIQEELRGVRSDTEALRQQQAALRRSLDSLSRQVHELQARSEYGSSALEEKVQALTARLNDIVTRLDRTLAPLEEFLRRQLGTDSAHGGGLGVDYYDAAQRDLMQGNYDLAEVGFLQFLEQYPHSELADDARYGLGESYYARKRFAEAAEEFERVIMLNPRGSRAPAAMLKLGLCHRALQNSRQARKVWEELIQKFPYSEEAKIAQQRLDELKGKR